MLFFPINFKFLGIFKKQRMILSEVLSFYLVKIFNINVLFLYFYQFHAHLYVLINYSHMYFMGETIWMDVLKMYWNCRSSHLKGKISTSMNSNIMGYEIILVEMRLLLGIGSQCAEILADPDHKDFLLVIF